MIIKLFTLILIIPIVNFTLIILFGWLTGHKGATRISLILLTIWLLICYLSFYYTVILNGSTFYIVYGTWLEI